MKNGIIATRSIMFILSFRKLGKIFGKYRRFQDKLPLFIGTNDKFQAVLKGKECCGYAAKSNQIIHRFWHLIDIYTHAPIHKLSGIQLHLPEDNSVKRFNLRRKNSQSSQVFLSGYVGQVCPSVLFNVNIPFQDGLNQRISFLRTFWFLTSMTKVIVDT